MTTWGQDVTTLLPVADVIGLSEFGDETVRVGRYAWDDVARFVADDCWRVQADMQPPRVLASGWPPPEVFERLRAHALDESVHRKPLHDEMSEAAERITNRATENTRGSEPG
jgi:hypothetical protein